MSHGRRLSYQPALDGIRAVAVIAVILFHAGVAGFGGGYIGVSVFFTLSGYLITALLLTEYEQTGTISFSTFYSRRVRRLLPASLACIGGVVMISALTDWFDGVADLFAEVIGALLQVENWVLIAGTDSYQNLLARGAGQASPLTHFWSLAIEEQFYWVWPLVVAATLAVARRRGAGRGDRRVVMWVIGGLAVVFSVLAPVIATVWGPDAAYWATPARVAEILIGAAAAVVFASRRIPTGIKSLGWIGLFVLIGCVVFFPTSGGPAYAGALPLVAVASATLVVAAQVDGALQRMLSAVPLVAIGKVSYGAYLFHWPLFVILDPDRVGVDGFGLLVIRLQATAVVTLASYYFLEQPMRNSVRAGSTRTIGGAIAVTGALVIVAATVVPTYVAYWQADSEQADAVSIDTVFEPLPTSGSVTPSVPSVTVSVTPPSTPVAVGDGFVGEEVADRDPEPNVESTSSTSTTSTTSTTIAGLDRPMRVVTAGDSTSGALANGLIEWAIDNEGEMQVQDFHFGGCGVLTGGERFIHEWKEVPDGCDQLIQKEVPAEVAKLRPDVVLISVAVWDLVDRRWDGTVYSPEDRIFQDRLLFDYTATVQRLLDAGAESVLLTLNPPTHTNWRDDEASDDPERQAVLVDVLVSIAEANPSRVFVADLWGYVDDHDLDQDRAARPDGVHWTTGVSTKIAQEFLVPELYRAAGVRPPAGTGPPGA